MPELISFHHLASEKRKCPRERIPDDTMKFIPSIGDDKQEQRPSNSSKWRKMLLSVLFLFTFLPSVLPGQIEGEDISQYLEDENISTASMIASVNINSWTAGDLTFYFEKTFFHRIGIEVGAGPVLPIYLVEIPGFEDFPGSGERRTGYSLHLHPKFYFTNAAPEYHYFGPQYRRRQYNYVDDDPVILHDFTLNYGYNLFIKDRVTFSLNAGIGFRFSPVESAGEVKLEVSGIAMPYNFRFGVLL
jgi:hypothetical protein